MSIATPPPDVSVLAARLRIAIGRLARRMRREGESHGLPLSAISALGSIERRGPLGLGELAEIERLQRPTITAIASALEQRALVERASDANDRRRSYLSLTPRGAQLLRRTREGKAAFLARRLRALRPAEIAVLEEAAAILERLGEGD
jgi:DNA-binding MarR family transcriptional regulator